MNDKNSFSLRMKFRHKDLLTLLISLFILGLGGCKNPSGVGLEVPPGEEISGFFTDTVSVHGYTVRDDSTQSTGFNQAVFGYIKHPVLGTTIADLALEIGMPARLPRIAPDAVIDSVILVLPYGLDFFGDTLNSTFALQVRPLNEIFAYNTFSTKSWKVRDIELGRVQLNRYAHKASDSLLVVRYINEMDSMVKVGPQLRIPLDKDYFRNLFSSELDSSLWASPSSFRNHVKGLYLSVDTNLSQGMGRLASFVAVDNVSGIELRYRQPSLTVDDDEDKIDTIRTFFPINSYNPNSGGNLGFASSVQNVYSTEVQAQLDNPDGDADRLFLHAPVGLRGKISFPFIEELKNQNILINKAELVLYVDDSALQAFGAPAPRLTLYREDIAGRRQNIPDGDAVNSFGVPNDPRSMNFVNFGGWYHRVNKRYVFHLTSYIQDVLLGKINGNELFIAPVSPSLPYVPVQPALNAGGTTVLHGSGSSTYKMKLNIYYTETGQL